MKTHSIHNSGSRQYIVLLILLGFTVTTLFAQDNTSSGNKKKTESTMRVKVITKDNKGNLTETDTVYTDKDGSKDTIIIKSILDQQQLKDMQHKMKEQQMTFEFDMDSLDSLSKQITAQVFMDDEFPENIEPQMFMFKMNDDGELEMLTDKNCCDPKMLMQCQPQAFCMPQQPQQQGWMQGYTPWGKIRNIKVKDKKHGKKIVIRTEDMDMYDFMNGMNPPPPPPPPIPAGMPQMPKMKKIIIHKNCDGKK